MKHPKQKERKMRNPVFKTLAIILFVSFLFPLGHAQGKELLTGKELVQLMQEYEKAERKDRSADCRKAGEFRGYVTGFYDATWFFYAAPDNITASRVVAVVAAFLKQNPQKWNRPAWDLVMEALREAFPKAK
jgi:hypothetical protein